METVTKMIGEKAKFLVTEYLRENTEVRALCLQQASEEAVACFLSRSVDYRQGRGIGLLFDACTELLKQGSPPTELSTRLVSLSVD